MNSNKKKVNVHFSALDPYLSVNKPSSEEKEISAVNYVTWGADNKYPSFLLSLYLESPTLASVINTVNDYVVGNAVHSNVPYLNDRQMTDLVADIAFSIAVYGGFALNVVRNKEKKVCRLEVIDLRHLRSTKKNDKFYYSPHFDSKSYGRQKCVCYLPFKKEEDDVLSSIYFWKNVKFQTYPIPQHNSAIEYCMIEHQIADFQLNEVNNGFAANIMISFNNGIPTDEQQEEIEEMIDEKFGGYQNAGRPLINFANDKDHSIEVTKIDTDNFIDKYNVTLKNSQNKIFTSWRCNPNLCGVATESNGFNSEEYESSFKLFNRTVIRPIQSYIVQAINDIFDCDAVSIDPFSIEDNTDSKNVEE